MAVTDYDPITGVYRNRSQGNNLPPGAIARTGDVPGGTGGAPGPGPISTTPAFTGPGPGVTGGNVGSLGLVGPGYNNPYVDRGITPGATGTEWGDYYRGLVGQGGGGSAGPAPEALTYQNVEVPTAEAASIAWGGWQPYPGVSAPGPAPGGQGGPGPGPGGGGPGPAGPDYNWDVSRANVSGLGYDPREVGALTPLEMAAQSQQFQNFNQGLYGAVGDFMNNPAGYTPEEFALLEGRAMDQIFGGSEVDTQNLMAQLNQAGVLGGGGAAGALERASTAKEQQAAGVSRDLALADADIRRQAAQAGINTGLQFAGQQGQLEVQQQQMQQQMQQVQAQMDLARQTGNQDAFNQAQQQMQQLQAQAEFMNTQAANTSQLTRNELLNRTQQTQMQTAAQRAVANIGAQASMSNAALNAQTQRELAMNQLAFEQAAQNAAFGQEAGLFNVGNQFQGNLTNAANNWQQQTFNANAMNQWNAANAAAGNAGNRWNQQMMLSGVQSDIAQQQYGDQLMLQLLGMQQGGANTLLNQGLGYAGQVYGSNPNAYTDPYAGFGGGGGFGGGIGF